MASTTENPVSFDSDCSGSSDYFDSVSEDSSDLGENYQFLESDVGGGCLNLWEMNPRGRIESEMQGVTTIQWGQPD